MVMVGKLAKIGYRYLDRNITGLCIGSLEGKRAMKIIKTKFNTYHLYLLCDIGISFYSLTHIVIRLKNRQFGIYSGRLFIT